MNNKYFAVLFFIVSTTALELHDRFREIRRTCGEKHGLNSEQLAGFKHHIDDEAGPYLLCFNNALRHLNDSGLSHGDAIVNSISHVVPPDIARETIDCCRDEARRSNASSGVERIVVFTKCFEARIPTVFYDLLGMWEKPVYRYLDTCHAE